MDGRDGLFPGNTHTELGVTVVVVVVVDETGVVVVVVVVGRGVIYAEG